METTQVAARKQLRPRNGRRLVLLPLPLQGHITPMLQLADILHSRGFSITILHTHLNSPNPSNFPHFTFLPIPDDQKHSATDINSAVLLVSNLNEKYEPIQDCLARMVSKGKEEGEPVVCLITDGHWYSTQAIADQIKIPRLVLRTTSITYFLLFAALPVLHDKGYFRLSKEDSNSDAPAPEIPPLKVKDIAKTITSNPEVFCALMVKSVKETKAAAGVIWNALKELEEPSLATVCQDFPNSHFPVGPFHTYSVASSSSLLAQDQSSISWLDTQAPKSVLYVSFGSLAGINQKQFLEIAWGLDNSNLPFLWVVRPGLIQGSESIEMLPDGFLDRVGRRGRIVKWAPQQKVLAHPAVGGFWTHSGWNSTLESICEGVPMICSPFFGDQPTNARYVTDVWKVGVQLENGINRKEIQQTIGRLMLDKEGEEIRERINALKEQVNLSLTKGGSGNESLENLVNFILSF